MWPLESSIGVSCSDVEDHLAVDMVFSDPAVRVFESLVWSSGYDIENVWTQFGPQLVFKHDSSQVASRGPCVFCHAVLKHLATAMDAGPAS